MNDRSGGQWSAKASLIPRELRGTVPAALVGIPAPEAAKQGLYVAEFYGSEIRGYTTNNRRNKRPICEVGPTQYVNGIAVDGKGNLIDPDGSSDTISVFAGPGMCGAKLGSVSDPYGQPADAASADAATGNIVIANFVGSNNTAGSISLCTLSGGCTVNLTNPKMYQVAGVALARNGDCWASTENSTGVPHLIYFKACSGSGRIATGFFNKGYGGLDIDKAGNLVSISFSPAVAFALYVYKGCRPACALAGGPFPLRGAPLYGHLNKRSTSFAVGNPEAEQVDIYSYSPKSVRYLYSFKNGLDPSDEVEGTAYNPRSPE